MTVSPTVWRVVSNLVRIDIAAGITLTAVLWIWLTWH
jgi:hypothetical protein